MKNFLLLAVLLGVAYQTSGFKFSEIFSDNFNETSGKVGSLLSKWEVITDTKHSHQQLNQYASDDVYIKYGYLYLRAQQRAVKGFNYTSGKVNLGKKVQFTYGEVELRVRAARGRGLSSIVSLTSGKWPPEIQFNVNGDIPDRVGLNLHSVEGGKIRHDIRYHNSGSFVDEFRTFKLSWDPNQIVWSVDGVVVHKVTDQNKIPSDPLFLELVLDVGGNYLDASNPDASTRLPGYLAVDHISITQWK